MGRFSTFDETEEKMDSIKNVFWTRTAKAQYAAVLGVAAGVIGGQVPPEALYVAGIQAFIALLTRRVTDTPATFTGKP